MISNVTYAVAVLIGGIVGVGIFALPYAVSQVGFVMGMVYLFFLTIIITYLHLAYGEIILRTNEEHRLPGYTRIYLGKIAEQLVNCSTIIGVLLILLVYIIVGGTFLSDVISYPFPPFYFHILFWLIMSIFVVAGLKTLKITEWYMTLFLIVIIVFAFLWHIGDMQRAYFSGFHMDSLLFPYGIILFSLIGIAAIGEITKILKDEKQKIKSAIIWGTTLSAVIYLIFIITVVGVIGRDTASFHLSTFQALFPHSMSVLISLFGVFLIATSYLTLGFYFKETLLYDFALNRFLSVGIVIIAPFLLLFVGMSDFVKIISVVGSLLVGFESIIIFLIYLQARKYGHRQPEYRLAIPNPVIYVFIFILSIGFLSNIIFTLLD